MAEVDRSWPKLAEADRCWPLLADVDRGVTTEVGRVGHTDWDLTLTANRCLGRRVLEKPLTTTTRENEREELDLGPLTH